METYFVISNLDGDTHVEQYDKEGLLDRLNPEDYGDMEFMGKIERSDTNYWGETVLIIKGEIIVPKAKEVVQSYDV